MVEVFRTNIETEKDAEFILEQLQIEFTNHKINFDLEDCDNILRIESSETVLDAASVIDKVKGCGFEIEILPNEVPNEKMSFYQQELSRIKDERYSKKWQIDTVIGTRNYIDNNFGNDLNLDLLSHISYTSKYHLIRLFKKYYGQTPIQYLTDKRIKESKKFLKNGNSATETCFAVGFESPSTFSNLFKRKTGYTPTEFQQEQFSIS